MLSVVDGAVVVPILRRASAEEASTLARCLVGAGLRTVEIALTTPGALEVVTELAAMDGVTVGVGSALRRGDIEAAAQAGAVFAVSPATLPELVAGAAIEVILGAATPTEVARALEAGCEMVKLFPARELGGPGFLRALRGPFPDLRAFPTGGIAVAEVGEWLDAGAVAVGMGGALSPARLGSQELARVSEIARSLAPS